MQITLPVSFKPRPYQRGIFTSPMKRFCLVWHRRSGKDKTAINYMAIKMLERVGVYYYVLPTYAQGRKIIWEGIDRDGFPFIKHIPPRLIRKKTDKTMHIELINGSRFQVVGSDNIDYLVGTNPVGIVLSEYSLQRPLAWDYLRPIVAENGGWAMFLFTPRGQNHGYDLYHATKDNPEWYVNLLTIEDTGVLTKADMDRERGEGMSEELIQQEYYCSFYGSMEGAYYAKQLKLLEEEGRIVGRLYDPNLPVSTYWDIGVGDATVIWFVQQNAKEVWFVDYYENQGEPLGHYIQYVLSRPYEYAGHYAPHDIRARELGTGKTRLEMAAALGINFRLVPKLSREDGINAVRSQFHRYWFDKVKCHRGLEALHEYKKRYDPILRQFSADPYDNWATHAADALRYAAISIRGATDKKPKTVSDFKVIS